MIRIFLILIVILSVPKKILAVENKILFKIDNEILTTIDIKNQSNYLKAVNQNLKNLEMNQVFEITKNSLIREKIKKNEILKIVKEIKVTEGVFNSIVQPLYLNLNLKSIEEFKDYLKKNNLEYNYVVEKLSINALWNQLIFNKFSTKLKINKDKIKSKILSEKNMSKQFLLSEIVFEVDEKFTLEKKFNIIEQNIKEFGFENAASRFSISDTSSSGGKLDWISEISLNKEFINEINKIEIGDYTKPMVIPGGFIVVRLNDLKEEEEKIDINEEVNKIIRFQTNRQLSSFSNIYLKKIIKNYKIEYL